MRLAIIPPPSVCNGLTHFEGDEPKCLNAKGEIVDVQKVSYISSPACWEAEYAWDDVHCLCYDIPTIPYCYRVRKSGTEAIEKKFGTVPMLNWVHFELDNPDHRTWKSLGEEQHTDPWTVCLKKLEHLLTLGIPELAHCGLYQTRGGIHIVWPLKTSIPVTHANSYLKAFADYLRSRGIDSADMVFDDSCTQWTRPMRMPRARREHHVLDLYRNFEHMKPLEWESSTPLVSEATQRLAKVAGTINYDLTPIPDDVLARLKGLKSYDAIVRKVVLPADLGKRGTGRNNSMLAAIGEVGFRLDTLNPNDIFQVLAPCILADSNVDGEAPTLDQLADRCLYNCQNRAGQRELEVEAFLSVRTAAGLEDLVSSIIQTYECTRQVSDEGIGDLITWVAQQKTHADIFAEIFPEGPNYTPRLETNVTMPIMAEVEKLDITEFDSAYSTSTAIKAMIRERMLSEDSAADVSWLRRLECLQDKSKDGLLTQRGGIRPSRKNIMLILQHDPRWKSLLYWNEMTSDIGMRRLPAWPSYVVNKTAEGKKGQWIDTDFTRLQEWFRESEYDFEIKADKDVIDAVLTATQTDPMHPVRDYLTKLEWDGVSRLDSMLHTYFQVKDSKYTSDVGRCWMISAVARVMNPGAKVDSILILGGFGGRKKSSGIAALCPNSEEWLLDSPLVIGVKEGLETLRGTWLVELAEMMAFRSKAELNAFKGFITSRIDKYRPSYGKRVMAFPRQFVVFATTNDKHFLLDDDGNRRYWTVVVERRIDLEAIIAVRDQLWAEAAHRYRTGEPWWLSDAGEVNAQEERMRHTVMHPWGEILNTAFTGIDPKFHHFRKRGWIQTSEILRDVLEIPAKDMRNGNDIDVVHAMRHTPWVSVRCSVDNMRGYFWLDPKNPENKVRFAEAEIAFQ